MARIKKTAARLKKYLFDRAYRFQIHAHFGMYDRMDDAKYLKKKFRLTMGKSLDLDAPVTFNEKLQYLKLYDRNPLYSVLVDKAAVKTYVAQTIGEQYVVPTLGVWENPQDIDFEALPSQFVLKCTHNSGVGVCVCKDKAAFDMENAKAALARGLQKNYYLAEREWPYKEVAPRILAEQYLENSAASGLIDYKIHCFNGVPRLVLVCNDRFSASGLTEDFFSPAWEHLPIKRPNIPNAATPAAKPEKWDDMLALAEKLAKDIPFVRVDFYFAGGRFYFSEMTFFPAAGFAPFEPESWDKTLGDWLTLPDKP